MPRPSTVLGKNRWLTFIVDHPYHTLLTALVITFLFAWQLPKLQFQTSIYDLAVEDISETVRYESFKKEFGTDEIIFVVANTENIFEPATFQRIEVLAQALAEVNGIRRVISLPGIRKDMDLTERWNLADFEKLVAPVDLFQRNLISTDKKKTIITLILEDIEAKEEVIPAIEEIIAEEKDGLSLYQIGMPLVSRALAEYTEKDFLHLPPITFLLMAFILFCLFRNLLGVLVPTGSVLVALTWTFGLISWSKTPLSMLTMIVPIVIIAVGTAYCMYILAAYFDSIGKADSAKEASFLCFTHVGFPTALAIITTTIGLGSLLLNKITAIREFAIFSCFGIGSLLIILLIVLPAVLALLPLSQKKEQQTKTKHDFLDSLLAKIITLNLRHQNVTLPIVAFITLISLVGIYQIKVESNPVDYFKKDTPISQHFHDIYQDMAGSFPLNVVLDSKIESYFEDPDNLMMISRLQRFFDSLDNVDKTISVVDYLKLINYATNQYKEEYYSLPEESFEVRMLMNSYVSMLGKDMFDRFLNNEISKINIILRTHIASSRDFLLIKEKIHDYLGENLPEDFDFEVTGFGIVISQSSHLLTKGQVKSISLTLVLIFAVMLLLFLSGKAAFIALIPNCFPIVINFGLMGWLGIELSIATSLIACIAIGLAVDDTIHYLVRYNSEFKKDMDKDRALHDTIKSVGRPIIFTTLTIGIGFSILLFSHFKPTAIFGLLMVITMLAALVGDLLLLPSLMLHVELVTAWDLVKLMPAQPGMSAAMAHELHQPLNAIKMGSEFLKMMIQQEAQIPQEHLSQVANEISDQVDRTAEIINRLRVFDQQQDIDKEEVDINQPIRSVLRVIGDQLRLENIEYNLQLDENLSPVLAHSNRMAQIVFNLVSNARDAINEKKDDGQENRARLIDIHSFRENNRVVFTVSDTGAGIPRHVRSRIFEPFFTTKETGKGKGLGLCITYQVVKDYRGHIEVQTEEGEGTVFKVSIPCVREAMEETVNA
jgi:hydrophobe/amphiphile efflux-3 (HAE3) family protein